MTEILNAIFIYSIPVKLDAKPRFITYKIIHIAIGFNRVEQQLCAKRIFVFLCLDKWDIDLRSSELYICSSQNCREKGMRRI